MDQECTLEIWNGLDNRLSFQDGVDLRTALDMRPVFLRENLLFKAKHKEAPVLMAVIQYDEMLDIVTTVSYFRKTILTEQDIDHLIRVMPNAYFDILYSDEEAQTLLKEEKSKRIEPITLREANSFVEKNHRHHASVTGCKFAIGLHKTINEQDNLIGVAICGRPVSRHLDDGFTLEINRLCVIENGNCASMLYGRCAAIAKNMGYKKIITYILESEPGTSLKASGFTLEDECCGGTNWTGSRKRNNKKDPDEMKQRWIKHLAA